MTRDEEWLLNEKYLGERTEDFHADCERLKTGEPLAYLIGHISFLNTTIYLDSHPLIPRPETEYWVEQLITKLDQGKALVYTIEKMRGGDAGPIKVLDLCAGSGCIGVAILKTVPVARVDFVEIDPSHHPTITKNIEVNGIDSSRAHILGGNLFEHITEKYDYILSNPPYIDANLARTDASVIAHEPHIALFGGVGGLSLIHQIIVAAPLFLTESGTLVLEHEPEQHDLIHEKAATAGFDATTYIDQFGIERYTILTRIPT